MTNHTISKDNPNLQRFLVAALSSLICWCAGLFSRSWRAPWPTSPLWHFEVDKEQLTGYGLPWPVPPDVDGSVVFERCQDDGHFDGGDEPICVWAPCSHLKETVIESYRKLKNAKVNDYRQGILNEADIMETDVSVFFFKEGNNKLIHAGIPFFHPKFCPICSWAPCWQLKLIMVTFYTLNNKKINLKIWKN